MLLEDPHEADVWSRNSPSLFRISPFLQLFPCLSFSLYTLFFQSHRFYISVFIEIPDLFRPSWSRRVCLFLACHHDAYLNLDFSGAFLDCELLSSPISTAPRIMLLHPCVLSPSCCHLFWRSAPVCTFPNYARENSVEISLINVLFELSFLYIILCRPKILMPSASGMLDSAFGMFESFHRSVRPRLIRPQLSSILSNSFLSFFPPHHGFHSLRLWNPTSRAYYLRRLVLFVFRFVYLSSSGNILIPIYRSPCKCLWFFF